MAGVDGGTRTMSRSKALGSRIRQEARCALVNELRTTIDEGQDMSASTAKARRGQRRRLEEEADMMGGETTTMRMHSDVANALQRQGRAMNSSNLQNVPYKQAVRPESGQDDKFVALAMGRSQSVPVEMQQRFPRKVGNWEGKTKARKKELEQLNREPKLATPGTARRGLPLPDYPWATPERTGVGFLDPPATGWNQAVRAPWIHNRDKGQALATSVHGQILDNWKGRRAPKEGDRPPWFEEQPELCPRHEQVSSIMAQIPRHNPETVYAGRLTLCSPDDTKAVNIRAKGGKQWEEYLSPTDPILQRSAEAHSRAVPHRDIVNLTGRIDKIDIGMSDTRPVNRVTISRAKMPRRQPRTNNWTTENASNFVSVETRRMNRLRGVQTMGCPAQTTLQLRRADPLKVSDNHFVLKNQANETKAK